MEIVVQRNKNCERKREKVVSGHYACFSELCQGQISFYRNCLAKLVNMTMYSREDSMYEKFVKES